MATRKKAAARSRTRTSKQKKGASRRPAGLLGLVLDLGFLRIALVIMAVLVMAGAPAPGTSPVLQGPQMWSSLLAPTLAPILFMVLMLDALMGRVLLGSAAGAERARYRRVVIVNLATGGILLLWWLPYFLYLFSAR